ncbi:MAG: DUF1289 domain-containing protein [Proteobacteria bacterium]|nr:DUF1289 domain-containing protein [Pseudomonadota bacterium]
MPDDLLPSPCISVCALDPATGLCLGCYRNRQEIKAWRGMSVAEQKAMLPCLHARRAALGGGTRQKRLTARALAKKAIQPASK